MSLDSDPVGTLRAVYERVRDADLPFVAAGLAYYSLSAVVPALVFGVLLLLQVGGPELAGRVVDVSSDVLSNDGQQFIRDTIQDVTARNRIGLIAAGLAAWGALQLYRGLDRGVAAITGQAETTIRSLHTALRVLLFGGLGTLGLIGVAVAASLYTAGGVGRLVAAPLSFVVAVAVTFPMLHGMADGVGLREALPGTLFTATTWTLGAAAVGLVASGQSRALYGVLGGLLLLLSWFYVANLLLLVGFAVNAVLAHGARSGTETDRR